MVRNRYGFYVLLLSACTVGYSWLLYNFLTLNNHTHHKVICLFKKVTHLPCPSCGATRSLECLLHGKLTQAILINPLGLIVAFILVVAPIWVTYDLITRKSGLYHLYRRVEIQLKKPVLALPLVLLILANWVWNISKGL
ncbi:Protein of unknown function [bacterium A37T11]|nr:Protein of unknown function [bacterium A37T11]